jgi:peptidoglycan/xylan/chitin deacetylase (PgdA/CDA1 family)
MKVPIFEYHDIGEANQSADPFHAPYVLPEKAFAEQISWLYENGCRTLTLGDLLSDHAPPDTVVLTFDDGHISNYESVFPILRRFNYVATFFIVPGFVEKPGYVTWEHLFEMQRNGMEFQSHSLNHPYILSLEENEIEREVRGSKEAIQQRLGTEVNCFSVPYGFYNRTLARIVEKAGYRYLVTEDFGYYVPQQNRFRTLPRLVVKSTLEMEKFRFMAEGRRAKLIREYGLAFCLTGIKRLLGFRMYLRLKSACLGYPYEKRRPGGVKC